MARKAKAPQENQAEYKAGLTMENCPPPEPRPINWKEVRDTKRGPVITSPDDVKSYLHKYLGGMEKEAFVSIYLDHQNHVQHIQAENGTVDHCVVFPREVMATALGFDATGIILAHNHPAGSLEPSEGDKQLTRQIVTASRSLGITVHDHLIVTSEAFFSFRQSGLLC